jgi:hypothetical protein
MGDIKNICGFFNEEGGDILTSNRYEQNSEYRVQILTQLILKI